MYHLLTTKLLLWIFAISVLPLSSVVGQVLPPVAPPQSIESDPATDADFYLDKAAAKIAEIKTFAQSLGSKTNSQSYPFRPIVFSKRDTKQAIHTLEMAKDQIDRLPDDQRIARLRRHRRLSQQARRWSNYLTAVRTSLQASLSPKTFPNLKTDAVRFRGLGVMLANIDSFETDPELAAAIIEQLPAARLEANRIAIKYDSLVQQETIAGLQLAGLDRYFESKRKSFEAIVKQQQQTLPGRIKGELASFQKALLSRSERRLSTAEASNSDAKPVELRSQLRKIKADLDLLEAIDTQSSTLLLTYRKQLFDLLVAVQKVEPADLYVGDDRDDLLKAMVVLGVKPDSDAIRIPGTKWMRRTYWRVIDDRWQKIDRSVLEVYLLSKDVEDANPSWLRFLLTKDHLRKDAISAKRDEWFLR